MSPYKDREGNWELDFGFKKVYFELEDRILINIGSKEKSDWTSIKILGVYFNTDGAFLEVDDGLEEEHIIQYPCQFIIDARN